MDELLVTHICVYEAVELDSFLYRVACVDSDTMQVNGSAPLVQLDGYSTDQLLASPDHKQHSGLCALPGDPGARGH